MRIAKVIGKLTLDRRLAEVPPGSYLLVRVCNRGTLLGENAGNTDDTIVMYDPLAAREGDCVGLVEGREASVPFHPKRVPFDAYNGCILDTIDFDPKEKGFCRRDAENAEGRRKSGLNHKGHEEH